MKFKRETSLQIRRWSAPPQVDVRKVETPAEQYERIQERVKKAREQMGSSYLCHEENRVRRIDPRNRAAKKDGVKTARNEALATGLLGRASIPRDSLLLQRDEPEHPDNPRETASRNPAEFET